MVVVLSEAAFGDSSSVNERELNAITEVARLFGCRVYPLPPNFDICETAENAFAYVPTFDTLQPGIWVGYIPTPEHYTVIYNAALTRNIGLVNTPDQYQTAMEFDRFYPLLGDLTPKSRIVTDPDQSAGAASELGFPLFIKGAVKSNKEQGWRACVAENMLELTAIADDLFKRSQHSRGRVILRTLARLRTIESDYQDFPFGREYRVFVYQNQVLAYGFYWDQSPDSSKLTTAEERAVQTLAVEAARRIGTPFIAIDIGQLESGEWIVIEVGDGQFSGLSQVPILELWSQLKDISILCVKSAGWATSLPSRCPSQTCMVHCVDLGHRHRSLYGQVLWLTQQF